MAEPVYHDLTLYKGSTFRQPIYFYYDDDLTDPIPLDGITAKSEIRPSQNSPKLIAEFDINIVPQEGKVVLELSDEITSEIAKGFYEYDLRLEDEYGDVAYYVTGKFIVTGRVTEP